MTRSRPQGGHPNRLPQAFAWCNGVGRRTGELHSNASPSRVVKEVAVSLFRLVIENVWMKKARSLLTAFAIAIAVMTVVSLGIVTQSLKTTAAAILATGQADFTVAQKHASDIFNSSVTTVRVTRLNRTGAQRDRPIASRSLSVSARLWGRGGRRWR